MPRHRKERVPLYRVRRRAVNEARRAPVHAAVKAPAPVPARAVTEEATETSTTAPLPALRRHLLQITSPAGPTALGGTNPAARAVRRLMVTPWFAVATGFVVAAGLWIYSPHAELKFPDGAVGRFPCPTHGCGASQPNRGVINGGTLLPMTSGANHAGKSSGSGGAPRGLSFAYKLIRQPEGRFAVLIRVFGSRLPPTWRLAFTLPGDEITFVQGADWQPSGHWGGTAIWPGSVGDWQLGEQAGDLHRAGDRSSSYTSGERGVGFIVFGVGAPVTPGSCSFNGMSCEFSIDDGSSGN